MPETPIRGIHHAWVRKGEQHGINGISSHESGREGRLKPGDVVVAFSVSGNSENVLKALEYAVGMGAVTIGMTGFDGGRMKKITDINLHVPTFKGEYGPVEDVHMVLGHLISTYLAKA